MEGLNQFIQDNIYLVAISLFLLVLFIPKKTSANQDSKPGNPNFDKIQKRSQVKNNIMTFISHWPEVYIIPIFILIGSMINYLLMQIWPDAIFLGPEQIQTVLYKTIASFLAYFLFFLRDRLDFKEAWDWYISPEREREHKQLTPWQKRVTYFWRLSVFVLVFALV